MIRKESYPMFNDVTIIIPTHNREEFLKRILSYYAPHDIKILVADSSQKRANVHVLALNPNIEYFHYPDFDFVEKMRDVVKKVQTPYIVMCADDDFIIPGAIYDCKSFLQHNTEYVTVDGKNVYIIEKKGSIKYIPYSNVTQSNDANDARTRIVYYFNNLMAFPYCLYRSHILKNVFEHMSNYRSNNNFFEVHMAIHTLFMGKHKKLDILYSFRDLNDSSGGFSIEAPNLNEDEFVKRYNEFLLKISEITRNKGINNNFIDKLYKDTFICKTIKNGSIFNCLRSLIPPQIRRQIPIRYKLQFLAFIDFSREGRLRGKYGLLNRDESKKQSIIVKKLIKENAGKDQYS